MYYIIAIFVGLKYHNILIIILKFLFKYTTYNYYY